MKGENPLDAARVKKPERWQLKKDADDISERIRKLSASPPTDDTRATITKLKGQKDALWKAYDEFEGPAVATPLPSNPNRQPKPDVKHYSIWDKSEAEREGMCRQLWAAVGRGKDNA